MFMNNSRTSWFSLQLIYKEEREREIWVHTKPGTSVPRPEQCSLAWLFMNRFLIYIRLLSFVKHCEQGPWDFDSLINRELRNFK
jgi:hypothetical protein